MDEFNQLNIEIVIEDDYGFIGRYLKNGEFVYLEGIKKDVSFNIERNQNLWNKLKTKNHVKI